MGPTGIWQVHLRWNREGTPEPAQNEGLPLEAPSNPARLDEFRAGLIRLPVEQEVHIVSDGVTASKPESMDLLLRNISRTAEAGENGSLIVLPEAAVVIKRSGTVGELDQLALDPALQPLREAAHSLDQNILVGVMWVVEGGSPRAGAILFRADRGVQVVDWNAHALGRGDGNMTVPTAGGEVPITVSVCADTP